LEVRENTQVRFQLYRAFDFDILIEHTDKIPRKINTLIQYLKNSTFKGAKFKN